MQPEVGEDDGDALEEEGGDAGDQGALAREPARGSTDPPPPPAPPGPRWNRQAGIASAATQWSASMVKNDTDIRQALSLCPTNADNIKELDQTDIAVFDQVKHFHEDMDKIFKVWYGEATVTLPGEATQIQATFDDIVQADGSQHGKTHIRGSWIEIAGPGITEVMSWKSLQAIPTAKFANCQNKD